MASSVIKKHTYKLTKKAYHPTFNTNSYVSPYAKLMSSFTIPAADVSAYGYPISGVVIAAGATIGVVQIIERSDGTFEAEACGGPRDDNSIVICFIK